jgi:DNA-binding helix-hairpin-helix protein with protein kinase domain
MSQFFDDNGHPILTGAQLGRGGEGAVFDVSGQPNWVAKLYHRPIPAAKREKLSAMVKCASPEILAFAAWPVTTLRRSKGGEVAGFIMPRIAAKDIHQLYSPAQRKSLFPNADWKFLLRSARNCAAAFSTLHKRGIVIGDVNQGNAQVSDKALVSLIDCDSFQFGANGRMYLCEVGVPHFVPPELQAAKLDQVVRTQNHDCFGLALLIFHLLFLGRHPFAGRYAGSGEMPIERAIREYRFAYSRNGAGSQMSPPPFSLPIAALPNEIADCFERAFLRGSELPNARPTSEKWVAVLESAEKNLHPCPDVRGHIFSAITSICPWCDIERTGGPAFFISVTIRAYAGHVTRLDVAAIWAEISAIQFADHLFQSVSRAALDQIVPQPLPDAIQDDRFLRAVAIMGAGFGGAIAALGVVTPGMFVIGIVLCVAFSVWWSVQYLASPFRRIRAARARKGKTCRSELVNARRQAEFLAGKHRNAFQSERQALEKIRVAIDSLEREKALAFQQLQVGIRDRQLSAYLESNYIANAKITGIGPGRVSVLLSNGIETAADINKSRIMSIPGFGPSLTGELLAWRRLVEGKFRFDATKGVPQAELQAVEMHFMQRRMVLEPQLHAGPRKLRSIVSTAAAQLEQIDRSIAQLEFEYAQATADLNACR